MAESKSMRVAYGEALRDIGGLNEKVVVCDADLAHATMTNIFAEKYPERFFNVGIAEANMTWAAAGIADSGLIPFISTFCTVWYRPRLRADPQQHCLRQCQRQGGV